MIKRDSFHKYDFLLIFCVLALVIIGVVIIYSAGFDPIDKVNNGLYKRQILWGLFGFAIMIATSLIDYKILGRLSPYIYGIGLLVLLFTALFATPVRNIRAWINFGAFSIQPSEFMKIAFILFFAKYLEMRERDIQNFRELFLPSLILGVPVLLILLQPDFGTASLFIPTFFIMLFVGGADVLQIGAIIAIAAIGIIVPMFLTYRDMIGMQTSSIFFEFLQGNTALYIVASILLIVSLIFFLINYFYKKNIFRKIYIPSTIFSLGLFLSVLIQHSLKEYQKRRLFVFLAPELDPHGSAYNIIQSKIAIGSGGFLGKGFLGGSQSQLGFLPEKTSDFIFAVIAEEWGFLGATVVLLLEFAIIVRAIQIGVECRDKFASLVAIGISSIFFFHVLINVGMVSGIMPVTGLPLTFISYGGSNLIMSMMAVGILLNIRKNKFAN